MSNFSSVMSDIKKPGAPARSSTAPGAKSASVKKIKVTPGGQVKQMAAAVAGNKSLKSAPVSRTAAVPFNTVAKPVVASPAEPKKRNHVDEDDEEPITSSNSIAFEQMKKYETIEESVHRKLAAGRALGMPVIKELPRTLTPTKPSKTVPAGGHQNLFEERLTLQQMKDDALMILQDRRKELHAALGQTTALNESLTTGKLRSKGPFDKAVAMMGKQLDALGGDIEKLERFGNGFEAWKINGLDAQTIRAMASWGIDVGRSYKIVDDEAEESSPDNDADIPDTDDDLFGDNTAPSSPPVEEQQPTEPSPTSTPRVKRIRTKPTSSVFRKRKPIRPAAPILQPVRAMQVEPTNGKATSTQFIDERVALRAMQDGEAAERRQRTDRPGAAFFSMGDKPKGRFRVGEDGQISMRKR